ncbi:hypothetical protein V8C35DRAFT_306830 [Trichoderma chlorosporum]
MHLIRHKSLIKSPCCSILLLQTSSIFSSTTSSSSLLFLINTTEYFHARDTVLSPLPLLIACANTSAPKPNLPPTKARDKMASGLTAEMLTIIRNRVHPFVLRILGLEGAKKFGERLESSYHPSLAAHLPSPADARAILDFFGLDSGAVTRVLEAAGPGVLSLPPKSRNKHGGLAFPLSDALLEAYQRSAPAVASPVPETYDGYFACAIQQGLRPEFACTVGLHPEDPRFEEVGEDFYSVVSARDAARDRVAGNKYLLDELWGDRIEEEGEASVQ